MGSPEAKLELELSEPTPSLVDALDQIRGDIVVLGAGGKMGPSLVRLALRATRAAGRVRRVIAVSRFGDPGARAELARAGAVVVSADLLDPGHVGALPEAPNVIYMLGQKFGTTEDAGRTWAVNAFVPGLVAHRYRAARIVVFSTGNVYPLWPVTTAGPREEDPVGPVGEYAQSALARERVFQFFSERLQIPVAILRLNYAIEPRYGVLRDIADQVRAGEEIALATGWVNVIWQRDANAVALRALQHCAVPPLVLNLTGRPAVSVRELALAFGRRFGVEPRFRGAEAATALLSDASRAEDRFGPPPTTLPEMIERVADWVEAGGGSLGKPTHFAERTGRF